MATFQLTCEHCNSPYTLVTSPANAKKQRFCSRVCMSAAFKAAVPPLLESLATRLEERSAPAPDGCILYTGQNNGIYGQIEYRRKTYLAHRASYMVHKGAIPAGQCVCHACDTPLCINPDHLWIGSYSDNVQDMYGKKRQRHNPRRKLSDPQVQEIKRRAAQGENFTHLGREFGVSPSYVSMLNGGHRRQTPNASLAEVHSI